jgi:hypothetical protein
MVYFRSNSGEKQSMHELIGNNMHQDTKYIQPIPFNNSIVYIKLFYFFQLILYMYDLNHSILPLPIVGVERDQEEGRRKRSPRSIP